MAFQEPERTPESTDQTALQKVMSMSSTTGSTQDDGLSKAYKLIVGKALLKLPVCIIK